MTENENRFTRISVLGAHRNADVVIPSNAPIEMVMGQVAGVLGEDARQNYVLTRLTGGSLRTSATLAEEGVTDGTILQFTRLETTAPSPTVFDLSEAAESATDTIRTRWTGDVRRLGLSLVAGAALATSVLPLALGLQSNSPMIVLGASIVLVLLGSVLAWLGSRPSGRALAGWGVALAVLSPLGGVYPSGESALIWLVPIVIGLVAAAATSKRPARWLSALVTLIAVVAAWYGLMALTDSTYRTAGLLGTFSLLAVGLMPQIALGSSGVFSAQRNETEMVRTTAEEMVVRAHDVLAGSVVILGLTLAVCVWQIIIDPQTNSWALFLAIALTIGAVLRQRPFPLAAEKLALWTVPIAGILAATVAFGVTFEASTTGALSLAPNLVPWVTFAALVLLGVTLLGVAHARIPEHIQAQLRQLGNTVESFALVATVPLAVGMFGTYSLLLGLLS